MSKISELINNENQATVEPKIVKFASLDSAIAVKTSHEMVNHPQHYQSKTGLEAIDVIEAFDLGFNLGNVIKYILRAGKKDATVQELEKAKWYLEREINKIKGN